MADPTPFDARRLVATLAAAALAGVAAWGGGLPLSPTLVSSALAAAMLAIAIVDLDRFRIPDSLSLPAIPAGLLASGVLLDAGAQPIDMAIDIAHVIGAVAGGASFLAIREGYWRYRGREGLGLGDVKLAAAAGAWTGWQGLPHVVLVACLLALAGIGLLLAREAARTERTERPNRIEATTPIPFGAALAPAIWIVWFARQLGWTG